MCLVSNLFILNMSTVSTWKIPRKTLSQIIFLLLLGFWRFFSRMYAHILFTTYRIKSFRTVLRKKLLYKLLNSISFFSKRKEKEKKQPKREHMLNMQHHTSVLASSGTPTNSWSFGERAEGLLKPLALHFTFLSLLLDLLDKIRSLYINQLSLDMQNVRLKTAYMILNSKL